MPTKSNMPPPVPPSPMQSKIGDASLKFGPDWLRALSSSETGGGANNNNTNMPSPGDGERGPPPPGVGPRGFGGFSSPPWGGSDRLPHFSKEHHHHHQQHHHHSYSSSYSQSSSSSGRGDYSSAAAASSAKGLVEKRFKKPENRYSREEMLALYDKNLEAPGYLGNFGTLCIDKMQPPLAFSQPIEEEIRIWHSPQPESSRQGGGGGGLGQGGIPIGGRGYAPRGRGSGIIDRGGRGGGRGRGGYYTGRHEEDDRGSFSRPRNFERSQSNHERTAWSERNGVGGIGSSTVISGEESSTRGGGSWRSRESFGGRRHEEVGGTGTTGGEDGWRKPRWRRGDDGGEDDYRSPSGGGRRLHRSWSEDEGQDSNSHLPEWARDNPSEESGSFDSSGAFHDDRSYRKVDAAAGDVVGKRIIESSAEPSGGSHSERVQKRVSSGDSVKPVIPASVKEEEAVGHGEEEEDCGWGKKIGGDSYLLRQQQHSSSSITNKMETESVMMQQRRVQQQNVVDIRASSSVNSSNKNNEEDHYRNMTEEAMNLVSKLIEEDGSTTRRPIKSLITGGQHGDQPTAPHSHHHPHIQQVPLQQPPAPSAMVAPPPSQSSNSSGSVDVWFYRDPQGSVQGPFTTHEMALWCSQGYFSGSLLLRRECDKAFITLLEMGKMYGRNPFVAPPSSESPPPPPIPDHQQTTNSALDSQQQQLQAQQILRQQQLLQQQQLIREQQQYMASVGSASVRNTTKEDWGGVTNQRQQTTPTAEQIQAQLLMSMAKSHGADTAAVDQLQVLFQRQLKAAGGDLLHSHHQQNKYPPEMMGNKSHVVDKSPSDHPHLPPVNNSNNSDPIQSLVQQLTSMTSSNTQQQHKPKELVGGGGWGQPAAVLPTTPNQWGSSHPTQTPWEYREQMAKLQQEEELKVRRRKEEEEAERKRLDEEERKMVEERKRAEEHQQRLEEETNQRKAREEQYLLQQQQQEALRKQQEEARQAEIQRQKELQRQQLEQQRQLRDEQTRLAEETQIRQEKERREKEQQQQQQFSWNSNSHQPHTAPTAATPTTPSTSKTLLEIQQEEALKQEQSEKKKKQEEQQQLRLQQQQQQQQANQKGINLKWAQTAAAPTTKAPIKSLTEIQAEEQAKLQKQQDAEREKRAVISHQHQQQQAWNAQLTWANRASAQQAASGSSKKVNGGVWDTPDPTPSLQSSAASKLKGSSNSQQQQQPRPQQPPSQQKSDDFMKLFSVGPGTTPRDKNTRPSPSSTTSTNAPSDEFTRWCSERLQALTSGSVDIPTFVSFLKDVESPYDVGDYVRSYLGDGKDAKEFSREFLERRSRWKNARKDGGGIEDNLCRPASAVNPNSNEFQEVKGKGKKTKKGKMQKVDSRILGFSMSAAADRLNREYDSTD